MKSLTLLVLLLALLLGLTVSSVCAAQTVFDVCFNPATDVNQDSTGKFLSIYTRIYPGGTFGVSDNQADCNATGADPVGAFTAEQSILSFPGCFYSPCIVSGQSFLTAEFQLYDGRSFSVMGTKLNALPGFSYQLLVTGSQGFSSPVPMSVTVNDLDPQGTAFEVSF